jgi:hypothetical protein
MMARIRAAPARLPTTLPTTCGVWRGGVAPLALAPAAAEVCEGAPAVLSGAPPRAPPPA